MQCHQRIGIESFVCGAVLEGRSRKSGKVMDSADRTLWNPCFKVYLVGEETVYVDLYDNTAQPESQSLFGGKVYLEYFIPDSIVPNNVKSFTTSRKAAATCSLLLKLSMMDWDSLKRWSSVDLVLLNPD